MGPLSHVRRAVARCHPLVLKPHWLVVSLALCLQPACASEAVLGDYTPSTCDFADPPSDTSDVTLYLSTFWDDPKEMGTLDDLLDSGRVYIYSKTPKKTRVAAQLQLNAAFENKKLPDVFQANGGSDVLRWVRGGGEASAVCPLDRLSETYGWGDAYFSRSLEPVSCLGSLYALPVGIHRLNVLFYNRTLWNELKAADSTLVEPAELGSLEQLLDQLGRIQQLAERPESRSFVPLAIGAKRAWPLSVMAFENVLLSIGGGAYQTLWQGGLKNEDEQRQAQLERALGRMLDNLRQLVAFSTLNEDVDWQDAVRQVGSGEALYTVTGDWGWAQLEENQLEDVVAVAFPGTESTFVYTPDSFAVPRESGQDGSRARGFLQRVVASPEALLAFSESKHSIPARRDFDASLLKRAELRETYRKFTDCSAGIGGCDLLLATSGLAPPPGFDSCFDDIEALLAKAVTGTIPQTFYENPRKCENPWPPRSPEEAAERLVEQLVAVAHQQFAQECRLPE
ncbi:MAG: ABC transporter substrate-binding protein [Myxococcales bacterium]|nr:MAG: ABC transporter substrate-binding protein [Myxococcales bacterium]